MVDEKWFTGGLPGTKLAFVQWRNVARVLSGLGVGSVFAYLVVRHLSWQIVYETLRDADIFYLVLAGGIIVADYGLRVVRWWLILRALGPDIPLGRCARPFLSSVAVDNLVGFRMGDAARTFGFSRALGLSPPQILGTLLIEHLLGLITVLALLFFSLSMVAGSGEKISGFYESCIWLGLASLAMLMVILVTPRYFQLLIEKISEPIKKKNRKLAYSILAWVGRIFETLVTINSARVLISVSLLSLFLWVMEGAALMLVSKSLSITVSSPLAPWLSLAAGTLGTLIPGAPGGIGTFDYFAALGMVLSGAPENSAAIFAIMAHFVIWFPSTFMGILFFFRGRKRNSSPHP